MTKKEKVQNQQNTENLPTVFVPTEINGVNFDSNFTQQLFEIESFKDESTELLSSEFLDSMKDCEMNAILVSKIDLDIKEETKPFIEMQLLMNLGYKRVFAGQFRFIQLWDMNECENGKHLLAIKFTYKGKENIKGTARTVNNFKVSSRKIFLKERN